MADDADPFPLLPIGKGVAYEEQYRRWLGGRGLYGRSLGDVVSRTRRAAAIADILASGSDAEVIFRLTQEARFNAMSTNVKSQLKRAVLLYRMFNRERRQG